MIEKKSHIEDVYTLKHRHDEIEYDGYDYENNLFSKLLSNVMFGNKHLADFLKHLQKSTTWMIDSILPIRNFWNYTVDKYYDKHNN